MVAGIALYPIFGKPLIGYLGAITYASFLLTASIGFTTYKGIKGWLPFRWHPRMAAFSLTLGAIHGFLGLSIFLNF